MTSFVPVAVALGLGVGLAVSGQPIEIRPAVELAFPAAANTVYQLETSEDLTAWRPLRTAILGQGTTHRILVAAAETGAPAAFFRLETNAVRNLNALLESVRVANKVPAVACAVVLSNRLVGLGAVGIRRANVESVPVTIDDKWHHGSLTKSMTATLAAVLIEEGRIRWETSLAEIFPDWAPRMNAGWRAATLAQLTSNRGGAPEDLNALGLWTPLWSFAGSPREARQFLLERLTVLAPRSEPGTKYEYSNAGFALAGHMLETVMDRSWEQLLTERLFVPLGMSSAGFGVPARPWYLDAPWGHQLINGSANPIEPGNAADNPPAIGPAATVHCSVVDLAKYAALHAYGHLHETEFLKTATLVKLHTAIPDNANYGHGWIEVDRPWAVPGKAYTHSGSNTQWFSVIWFAPAREFAVVATCNLATPSGRNPGADATDQIAGRIIQEFLN